MNFIIGIIGLSMILTVGISMLIPMMMTQPPALSVPVDCTVGESCYIQNYVDLDRSDQWQDYRCGPMSYDGHKGVDFRLKNNVQMREGVKVLAAADGTVLRLRDGMADVSIRDASAPNIDNSECGNGLVIQHNGDYETQYCHLKQGSLRVKQGQEVKRGEVLGEIGLSGKTEFPHLHFMLRNDEQEIIDPFAGKMDSADCNEKDYHSHFWQAAAKRALPYVPTALLSSGFASQPPKAELARDGRYRATHLPVTTKMLIFWIDMMGLKQGDQVVMQLMRPDRVALVNHAMTVKGNKAQQFQFAGKNLTEEHWLEGTYTGFVKVTRGDQTIIDHSAKIDIIGQE